MTLGGNLSNLSGLMISVAHPPQVAPRSQHMLSDVSRQYLLTPQFITNSQSRPRLHFPPQPRQEIWLTWLPRYPRPLHYTPNFILIFNTTWPHPSRIIVPRFRKERVLASGTVRNFYRTKRLIDWLVWHMGGYNYPTAVALMFGKLLFYLLTRPGSCSLFNS